MDKNSAQWAVLAHLGPHFHKDAEETKIPRNELLAAASDPNSKFTKGEVSVAIRDLLAHDVPLIKEHRPMEEGDWGKMIESTNEESYQFTATNAGYEVWKGHKEN